MHRIGVLGAILVSWVAVHGVASASMSIYMPPEEVARASPVIVRGTVLTSNSGYDPVTESIATYVTINVAEVHRGPDDLAVVIIREAGGRFGNLVHHVDAVPIYVPGEEVFAFLAPSGDGVLRTTGMFFGKFTVDRDSGSGPTYAIRDLDGRGRIHGRPSSRPEKFRIADLAAIAAVAGRRSSRRFRRDARTEEPRSSHSGSSGSIRRPWTAVPPEIGRLDWTQGIPTAEPVGRVTDDALSAFDMLSPPDPGRWSEIDSGNAVILDIEPARNPLANDAAAIAEMTRAMASWTDVPESRLALRTGNPAASFTATHTVSPAKRYPSSSIILFGDPYEDIPDPAGCSGVLAVGGYWRSTSLGPTVNGRVFHPVLRGYVIFNNSFECALGDPDNLAEVAAHELGHTIGLGHSFVRDAIMSPSAHGGGRGPRLGDDDRDAVHCIYPHALRISSPDGGETVVGGDRVMVNWTSSSESGPDDGLVNVEYSRDGGGSWTPAAVDEANDGAYEWRVPDLPGPDFRVRVVRHNRVAPTPAPFPDACSGDGSDVSFTVLPAPAVAGSVPAGTGDTPLTLTRLTGGGIELRWGRSCSPDADDYAIYRGSLNALRAGVWDHLPVTCNAGDDLAQIVAPAPWNAYYLIVPVAGTSEGTLGSDGGGLLRPESLAECAGRESDSTCP